MASVDVHQVPWQLGGMKNVHQVPSFCLFVSMKKRKEKKNRRGSLDYANKGDFWGSGKANNEMVTSGLLFAVGRNFLQGFFGLRQKG